MRTHEPFTPADLIDLDVKLLHRCAAAVPMSEIWLGDHSPDVIGLRHDVDNLLQPAVAMAEWEHQHGYASTYFILHTAPYWQDKEFLIQSLELIAEFGHEIGIHNNALAEAFTTGQNPARILEQATDELRSYGFTVTGTVAHGDGRCYGPDGKVRFVNDQLFAEVDRPQFPGLTHGLISLGELGLDYDANWLPRERYLSDSGGKWSEPGFDVTAAGFPFDGQLHMLVHPDWWRQAFLVTV